MTRKERSEANKAAWSAILSACGGSSRRAMAMWRERSAAMASGKPEAFEERLAAARAKPKQVADFPSEPGFLQEVMVGRQRFVCTGWQPYVRKDGQPTTLILWGGRCVDCGAPFQSAAPRGRDPGMRRCASHQAPGRRAAGRRVRAHG